MTAPSQQSLNMIANPTGGGLSRIAQTYIDTKHAVSKDRREEERLVEEKKTAKLARELAQQKIEAGQVDALLTNSKILKGVTAQFEADAKTNPMLRTNPKMYEQYMTEITKDLPNDVTASFKGVVPTPDRIKQINRRADRMVKVLTDYVPPEQYGDMQQIGDSGLLGQPSLTTNLYKNVKADPKAKDGGGKGGNFKVATLNDYTTEAASTALDQAGLPDNDASRMDYLNTYKRYFEEHGNPVLATRQSVSDMKQALITSQGTLWGTNDEYSPTEVELTDDERSELEKLESLEAMGAL